MTIQEKNEEYITVPKDTFQCMISDFGHLLDDFESITEANDEMCRKKTY